MHVSARTGADLTTTLTTGRHQLVVDEPLDLGGADLGPSPTELLAASIASCTAITIQMYLGRKGWEAPDLRVDVVGGSDARKADYELTIHVGDSLSEAQLERVLVVASRCPVRRILSSVVDIREQLRVATT